MVVIEGIVVEIRRGRGRKWWLKGGYGEDVVVDLRGKERVKL